MLPVISDGADAYEKLMLVKKTSSQVVTDVNFFIKKTADFPSPHTLFFLLPSGIVPRREEKFLLISLITLESSISHAVETL